jgi:hypothetical protein
VVHESMTFQFINGNRAAQVSYIVSEVLDKNGVLLLEEKFSEEKDDAGEWKANEDQKDEYKAKYFTPEELETKRKEVLSTGVSETDGMHSRMVSRSEMEAILKKNFAHVAPYWVSGNFAGYIATNNKQKFDAFMSSISDTSSIFSTPPVPTSPSRREDSNVTTRKLVNPDLLGLKERYVNESGVSVETIPRRRRALRGGQQKGQGGSEKEQEASVPHESRSHRSGRGCSAIC